MKHTSNKTKAPDDAAAAFKALAAQRPDAAVSSSSIAANVKQQLLTLSLRSAAGDKDAISAYLKLVLNAVEDFGTISSVRFAEARRLARSMSNWPVSLNFHPEQHAIVLRSIAELELGAELPIKLPSRKRPWSWRVVANATVLTTLNLIGYVRARGSFGGTPAEDWQRKALALPPLSEASAQEWFAVLWLTILAQNGDHPENNQLLRRLGEHRRNASFTKGQQTRATPRTSASNIRDGIRESLRLAFMRVVKTSPSRRSAK